MLPVGALGVAAYKMCPVHSGSPQPLIGITPFTAAGADAVYLSEGVSDRIADLLSRVPGLKVLAKSSVLRFRQLGYPTAEFRKRLGVDYVLSGQLTGNGQRIRLAVQLTPADQSAQLWSTTIESDSGVVEASAGAIARSLIRVLKLENASASLANTSLTANPQALQAYLLGRYHAERRDPESLRDSVRMLERAIELDAGFSAAHAALAMSRYYAAPKDHSNTRRVIEASLDAAATALRLDPGNAEAYLAIGAANYLFLWNWPTSDLNLVKAVAFNPSYATAHHIRANFLAAPPCQHR
jgi:TolB-like protein